MNLDRILSLKIKLLKDCDIEIDYDSFRSFVKGRYSEISWSAKLIDGTNIISKSSVTECLLGKNRLVKNLTDDAIEIRVEDIFGGKTGFHIELIDSEYGVTAEYRRGESFQNDVEYRPLTRDGLCWICRRNIKAKSEQIITFDSHKAGARTVIICNKCVEQIAKLLD